MLKALWSGAAGMTAQMALLDSLANDLANVNTPAYKKSEVNFADLAYRPVEERGLPVNRQTPGQLPMVGSGARVNEMAKIFTQGPLVETGNPWHLAIEGRGFLAVEMPDGGLAFTRDGSFHRDAGGSLVTATGHKVVLPFSLPEEYAEVKIKPTGEVSVIHVDGTQEELGRLEIYLVPNPAGMEYLGDNLYRPTAASGEATAGLPGEEGAGLLRQGFLEAANVDLAETMTKMILAQRAYEISSRAIRSADEMWSLANNLRR
ncbi:MAG: flagellar basal-body rod protein FlgG [Clostridia bacterium]|nr:flagellar basal-body rod protein FlgG [Clostridia bacterium]